MNQSEAVGRLLRGTLHITQRGAWISGQLDLDESTCTYLIDGGAPDGPEFGTAPIDSGSSLEDGTVQGTWTALR